MPLTEEKWAHIAQQFENKWNFPKCLGAIDGKHVVLQAPINSGSEYINYKSHFSIVLMATADADYNFTFVDIGCQGRISDGGVFGNTILSKKLDKQELKLPPCSPLNGREKLVPYVFVADAAFPLKDNIMKPYAGYHPKGSTQRIFNYRLSRARRIIENTFGIASSIFRVLRKPMLLEPEKAKIVVMSIVSLHNFLRRSKTSRNIYTPRGSFDTELLDGAIIPGVWRNEEQSTSSFLPLRNIPRRTKLSCQEARDEFAQYFMTNGAVSWQNNYA